MLGTPKPQGHCGKKVTLRFYDITLMSFSFDSMSKLKFKNLVRSQERQRAVKLKGNTNYPGNLQKVSPSSSMPHLAFNVP